MLEKKSWKLAPLRKSRLKEPNELEREREPMLQSLRLVGVHTKGGQFWDFIAL